jgi:hypothetical protein
MTIMPLTYDIPNGIGAGFLGYVTVRVARGECREVHPLMYAVALGLFHCLSPILRHWLWGVNAGPVTRHSAGKRRRSRVPTAGPDDRSLNVALTERSSTECEIARG